MLSSVPTVTSQSKLQRVVASEGSAFHGAVAPSWEVPKQGVVGVRAARAVDAAQLRPALDAPDCVEPHVSAAQADVCCTTFTPGGSGSSSAGSSGSSGSAGAGLPAALAVLVEVVLVVEEVVVVALALAPGRPASTTLVMLMLKLRRARPWRPQGAQCELEPPQ